MRVDRIENCIFFSNTFVLSTDKSNEVWLVDCGDFEKVLSLLRPSQKIKGVLLTHSHFDHIYGLNDLVERYPNCNIYTNDFGKKALYDDKLNFSKYNEFSFTLNCGVVETIGNESNLNVLGFELEVIETPGHDPSCLTFRIDDYLFTGDSFIPGVKTLTTLRGGNKKLSENSILKINNMINEKSILCPGHGEMNGPQII